MDDIDNALALPRQMQPPVILITDDSSEDGGEDSNNNNNNDVCIVTRVPLPPPPPPPPPPPAAASCRRRPTISTQDARAVDVDHLGNHATAVTNNDKTCHDDDNDGGGGGGPAKTHNGNGNGNGADDNNSGLLVRHDPYSAMDDGKAAAEAAAAAQDVGGGAGTNDSAGGGERREDTHVPDESPQKAIDKQNASSDAHASPKQNTTPSASVASDHDKGDQDEDDTEKIVIDTNTQIHKRFDDGLYYYGSVISDKPYYSLYDFGTGVDAMVLCWKVRYWDDGQTEDLSREEILEWIVDKKEEEDDDDVTPEPHVHKKDKALRNKEQNEKKDNAAAAEEEDNGDRKPAAVVTGTEKTNRLRPSSRRSENIGATKDIVLPNVIGTEISKFFAQDGQYYKGRVVGKPTYRRDPKTQKMEQCWKVKYTDGDEEDLTRNEIVKWAIVETATAIAAVAAAAPPCTPVAATTTRTRTASAVTPSPTSTKKQKTDPKKSNETAYDKAKRDLSYCVGIDENEVVAALDKLSPPYSLNEAMRLIHKAKIEQEEQDFVDVENDDDGDDDADDGGRKFLPTIGLRVCRYYEGNAYHGRVTGDAEWKTDASGNDVRMWEVTFDEWENESGAPTVEDFDFNELLTSRADRPRYTQPIWGRQLCALELFSGCSIVTEEFASRKWRVRSIDNASESNATDNVDIMKMTYSDMQMVPDFIWASPPCFTYSRLAGGKHRTAEPAKFDLSPDANLHNRIFARMVFLMKWVKQRNPHVIVVIENPEGLMAEMPLMKEFERSFGLHRTTVHYCALGRMDKKPTHLWTNDYSLFAELNVFKCSRDKCPYFKGVHPIGVRGHGHYFNAAAIPRALAEGVADNVHRICGNLQLRRKPAFKVQPEDEVAFNLGMSDVAAAASAAGES